MISIIIPVHNREPMLHSTLRPLVGRADCEVVVSDDCSTDLSAAVAEQMGAIVVRSGQRRGPAAARNSGMAAARHKLLLFLDADIVLPAGYLEELVETMTGHPSLLLTGLRRQLAENAQMPARRDSRELVGERYSFNLGRYRHPWALCYSCIMAAHRELFRSVSLDGDREVFDSAFSNWGLEDTELALRLYKAGATFALLCGSSADHQYHDRSMTVERYQHWSENLAKMLRSRTPTRPTSLSLARPSILRPRRATWIYTSSSKAQTAGRPLRAFSLLAADLTPTNWISSVPLTRPAMSSRREFPFPCRRRVRLRPIPGT